MIKNRKDFHVPLLGFAAYSGTGKTTLLSKIIPLLKEEGIRIGVIKHAHHDIDIDHPKKDSFVLREAGATKIVVASRKHTAIIIEHPDNQVEPTLEQALKNICTKDIDLILVEGFKLAKLPKIELHREELNKPYLYPNDENIIAISTDHSVENDDDNVSGNDIPHLLDLNKPLEIVEFIQQNILNANKQNTK